MWSWVEKIVPALPRCGEDEISSLAVDLAKSDGLQLGSCNRLGKNWVFTVRDGSDVWLLVIADNIRKFPEFFPGEAEKLPDGCGAKRCLWDDVCAEAVRKHYHWTVSGDGKRFVEEQRLPQLLSYEENKEHLPDLMKSVALPLWYSNSSSAKEALTFLTLAALESKRSDVWYWAVTLDNAQVLVPELLELKPAVWLITSAGGCGSMQEYLCRKFVCDATEVLEFAPDDAELCSRFAGVGDFAALEKLYGQSFFWGLLFEELPDRKLMLYALRESCKREMDLCVTAYPGKPDADLDMLVNMYASKAKIVAFE